MPTKGYRSESERLSQLAHERDTYSGPTELRKNSMNKFFFDRTDVVRCVSAQLKNLQRNSVLIMTIERDKSGDYFVSTVTSLSSVGTAKNTPIGSTGLDVT